MERGFFMMRIKPGSEEEYDRLHRNVWHDVLEAIERSGVKEYSIFRDGLNLYAFIAADDFEGAMRKLSREPAHVRWGQIYGYIADPDYPTTGNPTAGDPSYKPIPEVFRFEAAKR